MKILRMVHSANLGGGRIYEDCLSSALAKNYQVKEIILVPKIKTKLKYLLVVIFFYKLFILSFSSKYDYTLRTLEACFFLPKSSKNIVVAHHYDTSYSNFFSKSIQLLSFKALLYYKNRVDVLIVVSKFWEEYFSELGFENVHLIYNSFDVDKYHRTKEQVINFKKRHNLTDKPIIYLGNAQKKKGADLAFETLKDKGYYLVTSGQKQLSIDTINLDLTHDDYITLLHASTIAVLLSRHKEGWNRVAHEAMLCKTPVIGSGVGGMSELLDGGQQVICTDVNDLTNSISKIVSNYKTYAKNAYNFSSKFDLKYLYNQANEII